MGAPATDREFVRRHGLIAFVECAWHQIEAVGITIEPHMPLVCDHLTAVSRGEIRDLVIEVPPGTSKSTICSILWPAWDWIEAPWRKWLNTSYAEDLSLSFARRMLELVTSPWYLERWNHFGIKGGGRAAAGDFWNTLGGRRFSTMIQGVATGVHAHILVCDDPHKPDELKQGGEQAKRHLEDDWKAWTGTFSSRHADAATFSRVVIAQRLHENDISGRMLRSKKTVNVHLPMEFVPKRAMSTKWGKDWRTKEGELLAPKRFPPEVIEAKKDKHTGMSTSDYAAQMQQSPAPESGNLFQEEWFGRRWTVMPPRLSNWFLSSDLAFKDTKSSDFVAIGIYAHLNNQLYMIDLINRRMGFTESVAEIQRLYCTWPQIRSVLIEDKANGPAVIEQLQKSITGIIPVEPRGSKYARAVAATQTLKGLPGVVFPERVSGVEGGMEAFVNQCKFFPMGTHDDMVDQLTQAIDFSSTLVSTSLLDRYRGLR